MATQVPWCLERQSLLSSPTSPPYLPPSDELVPLSRTLIPTPSAPGFYTVSPLRVDNGDGVRLRPSVQRQQKLHRAIYEVALHT